MINVLVRSLVRRGYVRATRAGWRRWVYVLTPAGATRKVNLTIDYVDRFMDHYRRVRSIVRTSVDGQAMGPDSSVGVYGVGEVAEIVYVCLRDCGVEHIEILDANPSAVDRFLGHDVLDVGSVVPERFSKVIVADTNDAARRHSDLRVAGFTSDQIVTIVPVIPDVSVGTDPEFVAPSDS